MLSGVARTFLSISMLIFLGFPAFADDTSMETQKQQATTDLQALYQQWRQSFPKDPSNSTAFYNYLLTKQDKNNAAYGQMQYNSFNKKLYQPIFVLPGGGWVMNVEDAPSGISTTVDINGGNAPGFRGAGLNFDQKMFIFNGQGQVAQVLD